MEFFWPFLVSIGAGLLVTIIMWLLAIKIRTNSKPWFFFENAKWASGIFSMLVGFYIITLTEFIQYNKVVLVLLIIIGAWLLTRLNAAIVKMVLNQYTIAKKDNLRERKLQTQLEYVKAVINVAIVILAVGLIMLSFDTLQRFGMSLLASAGVAGIVIAFAAQKTLTNLLAGFQIAFTQPIRIDDVVIVDGEWGRIEEITLTYVVVKIWDQRRLVVPVTYFTSEVFQNWTRTSADIWGTVVIHADYSIPIDKVRKELTRICKASKHWDKDLCLLQVTEAGEKTIQLRALVSAKDSGAAWDLRCEVREGLVTFIQKKFPKSLPKLRLEK